MNPSHKEGTSYNPALSQVATSLAVCDLRQVSSPPRLPSPYLKIANMVLLHGWAPVRMHWLSPVLGTDSNLLECLLLLGGGSGGSGGTHL